MQQKEWERLLSEGLFPKTLLFQVLNPGTKKKKVEEGDGERREDRWEKSEKE